MLRLVSSIIVPSIQSPGHTDVLAPTKFAYKEIWRGMRKTVGMACPTSLHYSAMDRAAGIYRFHWIRAQFQEFDRSLDRHAKNCGSSLSSAASL